MLIPPQRNDKIPHPVDNILAVTPESATSMAIIGRARDLGMCKVAKKDGKPCGSWTDKRVSDVCEWHLTNAVQRQRAGRAEFTAGFVWASNPTLISPSDEVMTVVFSLYRTSGMTTTTTRKRKPEYDPARQWGLQPEPAAGSSVYIVSGHVVGGVAGDMFTAEKLGREAQEKAKRRLGQDADKELKTLLDRDKEGMRAVTKAREVAAKMLKASEGGKGKKANKGKGKAVEGDDESEEPAPASAPAKPAYSASIIKHLGFDPAAKPGRQRTEDLTVQKKVRPSSFGGDVFETFISLHSWKRWPRSRGRERRLTLLEDQVRRFVQVSPFPPLWSRKMLAPVRRSASLTWISYRRKMRWSI